MNSVLKNWKSSLAGILSTIVALAAGGMFAPNPWISTKTSAGLLFLSGSARIVLGLLQTDAPQPGPSLPSPLEPSTPSTPPTK